MRDEVVASLGRLVDAERHEQQRCADHDIESSLGRRHWPQMGGDLGLLAKSSDGGCWGCVGTLREVSVAAAI